MNLEVIKFGGSALATKKNFEELLKIITSNNSKKIIVVSAMGRSGFPYATDSLLKLVNDKYLKQEEYHRIVSCGEIISSIVFNNYLRENNLNSCSVSYLKNGIILSNNKIILEEKYLKKLINEYDYLIVPGFVAKDQNNEIVTLGRGNSDLSAVLLAKMFSLNEVKLYKDVEGVLPFLHYPIKCVLPYEILTSKELEILLTNGAKIISLDSLSYAREYKINMHILPFENNNKGTFVKISDEINKDYIGLVIDNKTFKILCKNPEEVKQIMHEQFLKMHVLIKKEEINNFAYSFLLKSSQNLLLKKSIIKSFFAKYFLD